MSSASSQERREQEAIAVADADVARELSRAGAWRLRSSRAGGSKTSSSQRRTRRSSTRSSSIKVHERTATRSTSERRQGPGANGDKVQELFAHICEQLRLASAADRVGGPVAAEAGGRQALLSVSCKSDRLSLLAEDGSNLWHWGRRLRPIRTAALVELEFAAPRQSPHFWGSAPAREQLAQPVLDE